ncbi:hypothetical protein ABW16_03940 [Mycolicibacter heraklionensis]|uniref:Uncharacterized protein n=1 Tax=Mycolicibacter heraklionensis TaxID=512402 RepID=A0ABR5FIY7_9MYCO|nr:hypothetical protein ABW16_03940 [Mycolicibacter heraklionensis]
MIPRRRWRRARHWPRPAWPQPPRRPPVPWPTRRKPSSARSPPATTTSLPASPVSRPTILHTAPFPTSRRMPTPRPSTPRPNRCAVRCWSAERHWRPRRSRQHRHSWSP